MAFIPSNESLAAKIEHLQRRVNDLESAARLPLSSIGSGGLTVRDDGSVQSADFDGDLATDDPGTSGWAMATDKAAFATLLLRDQLVGPDSLGIGWEWVSASELTPFAITTTETSRLSTTLTVPDWPTEVIVFVHAFSYVENETGGNIFGEMRTEVEGATGSWQADRLIGLGDFSALSASQVTSRTLLPASNRDLAIDVNFKSTGANLGTTAGKDAHVSAMAFFKA